ncbi:unnamed protein product [Cuscuta campestris]|uniref:Transmembrane protein n=1 Tax=Cuscuta campestris TaxID=132261 RepID=A0A484LKY5_9ASTE|nr:unnamed protein product [Cuscuta campestris]
MHPTLSDSSPHSCHAALLHLSSSKHDFKSMMVQIVMIVSLIMVYNGDVVSSDNEKSKASMVSFDSSGAVGRSRGRWWWKFK